MEHIENNGCIGHPITNLLMQAANAADMGAADHADHGAVVPLENGNVIYMTRRAENIELAGAEPAEVKPAPVEVDQLTRIEQKLDSMHVLLVRHLAAPRV